MLIERFLTYASFDTQSDPKSETIPSTDKQLLLGKYLVKQLQALGVKNAHLDEFGYVYAFIKGNQAQAKKIGFIAHMDTAAEFSGKNVKARVIENYDGKDIKLNEDLTTFVETFDFLPNLKGKTLIVTDGTSLLGADNKAGIAEIISLVEYLMTNELNHGDIFIAFTPDEEIGRGALKFDLNKFKADFAYTVDGGQVGSIEFENFNAASANVLIIGKSIHPGDAKNKMINALNVAIEYHHLLDFKMRPEYTEAFEGFYHLNNMKGDVAQVQLEYIIRNHDQDEFDFQKDQMLKAKEFINQKYKEELAFVKIEDSYYNMSPELADKQYIIDIAKEAINQANLETISGPIRGGTDGALLTYMGLPCPNLGTGGYNFHGPYELAVVEEMHQSVEILINIVKIVGGR